MKCNEAIRKIMEKRGVSFTILMGRLDIGSNVLGNRLTRDISSVKKLSETVKAMDYRVVLVPCETRLNSDCIEVE